MKTTIYPLARIHSTGDGDTLRLQLPDGGDLLTIRLTLIDAPETGQKPTGPQAAERLRALLPKGAAVRVRATGTDQYGRVLAELYHRRGHSVNLRLVREGHAAIYRRFFKEAGPLADRYEAAERWAKAQHLGMWGTDDPVMPWDWRRQQKTRRGRVSRA